jgi:hypothetical protein
VSDEYSHAAGEAELWAESWYFDFVDATGELGGYLRLCSYPNLGAGWAWLFLVGAALGDAGPVQVVEHHLPPPTADGDRILVTGRPATCELRCHAPFDRWSVRMAAGDASVNLSWKSSGPEYRYTATDRYEQPCDVAGEITVAGRTLSVDTAGQRDHSWGVRDWWRIPWLWFAARLDDGSRVHVTQLLLRRPFPPYGYVDLPGGGRGPVEECQVSGVPGTDGVSPRRTELSLGSLALTLSTVQSTSITLDAPDGRTGTLRRSLVRISSPDGRTGAGWLEWNIPNQRKDLQRSTR